MILRKYTLTFCLAVISCAATRYLDSAMTPPTKVSEEVSAGANSTDLLTSMPTDAHIEIKV